MRNESIKILFDKIKEIKDQPYRYIPYKQQLKTKEWAYFKLYITYIKGGKCEMCGHGNEKYLHIHHKKYKNKTLAWQYEPSEVMLLCNICHKKAHMPELNEKYNRTKSINNIINGKTKKR